MAFVNASSSRPQINHLHELEIRSALRQKAGRGELTQTECDALIAQVESDQVARMFCQRGLAMQLGFAA